MNDYKFGNFLYRLRTNKGLSQSQLGEIIGVSNKAVSKWEMGVSKPRPATLLTLATFFDVTVEELLSGEKNEEIGNENRKESNDDTLKLWTGEYLKKKKRGLHAVITAIILPIILFIWIGVIVELYPADKVWGPIGVMVIFFAEAIDIALIFVFYGSARRLKRILYNIYHGREEEIKAVILPKREKIPMLKWERICSIISGSVISLFYALKIIAVCLIKTDRKLHLFNVVGIIPIGLAFILELIVVIHYCIRVYRNNNQK